MPLIKNLPSSSLPFPFWECGWERAGWFSGRSPVRRTWGHRERKTLWRRKRLRGQLTWPQTQAFQLKRATALLLIPGLPRCFYRTWEPWLGQWLPPEGASGQGRCPDGASDSHMGGLDKWPILTLTHRVLGGFGGRTPTHTPKGCLLYELLYPWEKSPRQSSA